MTPKERQDASLVMHAFVPWAAKSGRFMEEEPVFPGHKRSDKAAVVHLRDWFCRSLPSAGEETHVAPPAEDWESTLLELFSNIQTTFVPHAELQLKLYLIERQIVKLASTVRNLQEVQTITVPIETLEGENVVLLRPFSVVVQSDEDEFTATWFDANIGATGDNQVEAVAVLKQFIAARFDHLLGVEKTARLGPGPRKQLAVMKHFLKPR